MGEMFAPLAHPAFRWLLTARTTTVIGNAMAPIALAFAVLDLTSSVTSLGIVVAARSLTNVAFLLWGGVVADRLPRHLVLVGSCAVSAASQALVAALVLTGSVSVPWLVVLSAVNGMSGAFALPASSALVPQTVPPDVRLRANALLRLGVNSANIGGASLGGLLVAFTGPGWGLAVDALSFALAGVFFAFVRVPGVRPAHKPPVLAELKAGWTEFVSRQWVWVVVLAFTFVNAAHVGGLMILGPVLADSTFGRETWGFVLAAQTAGMVAGAFVAMRIRVRRLLLLGVTCVAAFAGLPVVMVVHPEPWLLVVTAFVCGLGLEQFGVAWETSLQHHVPADKLARVYSYDMLGSFVAIPLAQLAVGPVSHAAGIPATLLGCAALYLLATAGMVASRSVRSVENVPADVQSRR
ncbi:Predicted arabinose efflux permease, MFS family [Lentzea fradiae]|uniref:Predicted arabinose efflux permease, MFS family n=1 Tax=Lentzea fradiae TaxID=200378 RepID=A0A1G7R9A6_9PSEU|nr:MFS transporter [Lentzea fradiae]SDG07381.1 Predicted arabinose efflux permease, MFS family [Lentzea fradiae]